MSGHSSHLSPRIPQYADEQENGWNCTLSDSKQSAEQENGWNCPLCDSKQSAAFTHPDMLEVERQVSDKRFDQSFLHSEVLFCFFKCFIFDLFKISAVNRSGFSLNLSYWQKYLS